MSRLYESISRFRKLTEGKPRAGFNCKSCGQPLRADEEGKFCSSCTKPEVQKTNKAVRDYYRPEPESRVIK